MLDDDDDDDEVSDWEDERNAFDVFKEEVTSLFEKK